MISEKSSLIKCVIQTIVYVTYILIIIVIIIIIILIRILSRVISINDDMFDKCLSTHISNGIQPPVDIHKQRKWDKTVIDAKFNHLLSHYSEPYHKARLLAAAACSTP